MNARTLIVVVLAVVCGLSAVFLVKALQAPSAPAIEMTAAVYAIEDIRLGELVVEKNVEIRQVPVKGLAVDAVRKIADAVGRVAQSPLDKDDVVREVKLATRGASQGIAALIPNGMRPFGVQLPANSTPAGNFKAKDRVDVVLMENLGGSDSSEQSGQLLLQDVEVFMVGMTINPDPTQKANAEDARLITLLVTPEDARKLSWARTRGTLDLLLRNPNDRGKEIIVQKAPPLKPAPPEGLEASISPGMRAFTIDSPNFSATLNEFLAPDQRVDILLTAKTDEEYKELTGGGSTKTILENIKILAVNSRNEAPKVGDVVPPVVAAAAGPAIPDPAVKIGTSSGDARTITLEVTPSQAQVLDLGQLLGKLHLSLRGLREDTGKKEDRFVPFPGTALAAIRKETNRATPPPQLKTLLAGELNMVPPKQAVVVEQGPRVLARMQVRTLRGTNVGADSWTVYEPTDPVQPRPDPPQRRPNAVPPRIWASH